jgi:hypothetical protein
MCQKIGVSVSRSGFWCTDFKLKWAHGGIVLSVSCKYLASLIVDDTRKDLRLVIEESNVERMEMAMTPAKTRRILRRLDSELWRIVNIYYGLPSWFLFFVHHDSRRRRVGGGWWCLLLKKRVTVESTWSNLSGLSKPRDECKRSSKYDVRLFLRTFMRSFGS